jgi:hypothetical protein
MVASLDEALEGWLDEAGEKLARGELSLRDLRGLRDLLTSRTSGPVRQRLLYLHAREPSVTSQVIGWAEHPGEDPGGLPPQRPYPDVLAALADGWRCIHFPQQLAPADDRELDLAGYEFILEKLEPRAGSGGGSG